MSVRVITGDSLTVLKTLPAESVHCVVTSPPYYGLRCYGVDGQMGQEPTIAEHVEALVAVFREVRRVLRKDGVVLLNYGDAYATAPNGRSAAATKAAGNDDRTFRDKPFSTITDGLKPKDLCMLPARVALALQADGWWVRSQMPWVKRNAMPESVTDRPASSIEYVYQLTKSARYFWDAEAVRQNGAQPDRQRNDQIGGANGHEVRHSVGGMMQQTSSRNFRNSDLFFGSLEPPFGLISGDDGPLALDVNPAGYPGAHFATFPPKLIEPLIKAGTSEKGCCPECGAPWVREVERGEMASDTHTKRLSPDRIEADARNISDKGWSHESGFQPNAYKPTKTLGWSPSCGCNAWVYGDGREDDYLATSDCVVLDPFGGAGTTALVADRLGRDAIIIELNPEYADMARTRFQGDAGMFGDMA